MDYTIGVDGGGTKTHAVLIDNNRNILDECFYGPANIRTNLNLAYNSISGAIDELILKHGLIMDKLSIGVGVAGYSVKEKRDKLIELLHSKYSKVRVDSDCHVACLAAHNGKDGAVVICGTGVVGYYISGESSEQIGGWGFPHGDLGGAAWIGLEICKLTCKAIDGAINFSPILVELFNRFNQNPDRYKTWLISANPSDYATIAEMLPQFKTIDRNACSILESATNEVLLFVSAMIHKVPNLSIKLVGGLAPLFIPVLKAKFPQIMLGENTLAIGACFL